MAVTAQVAGSTAPPARPRAEVLRRADGVELIGEFEDSGFKDPPLLAQRGDGVVDHLNSATARARCIRCGATAVAFQIVLVSGSPTTVTPRNTAEAINLECTECVTVAEARQFVRVVPVPVRFTGAGRAVLADVRSQLSALEAQNLSVDQLHQAVEAQEGRVLEVLRNELVLKSAPDVEADALEGQLRQASDLD